MWNCVIAQAIPVTRRNKFCVQIMPSRIVMSGIPFIMARQFFASFYYIFFGFSLSSVYFLSKGKIWAHQGPACWLITLTECQSNSRPASSIRRGCNEKASIQCIHPSGLLSRSNFCEMLREYHIRLPRVSPKLIQGDTAGSSKPPVDFKTQVLLWPGLYWPGQAKAELLSWSQREVWNYLLCHPVQ